MPLPSGIWRLFLAAGFPAGYTAAGYDVLGIEGWGAVYVVALSVGTEAAALLTLGLVRPWGEVLPRVGAARRRAHGAGGGGAGLTRLGSMATLLVVHHSPTRGMRALTDAVLDGARDDAIEGVEVVVRPALEATADDVLAADGYLLGTTANFGYMSGALKHFFDSTFLAVGGSLDPSGAAGESEGETKGRPFGLYVHGRYDTTGAVRSVLSIVGALQWKQSFGVLEVLGDVEDSHREEGRELGGTIAALLTM